MSFLTNKYNLLVIFIVDIIYNIFQIEFSIAIIKVIDALTVLNKAGFNNAIILLVACVVFQNITYLIKIYCDKKFIRTNMVNVKKKMYNNVFKFSIEDFTKKPTKYYTSFFLNDLNALESRYYGSILSIIDAITLLVCASIGIIYVNYWFLLCLPITMLACIYFPKVFDKKLQKISNRIIENNLSITGITEEQMNGFITIKIFKMFDIAERIRNSNIEKSEKSKEDLSRYISFSNALLSIFAIFLTFSIYYLGGRLVFSKIISLSGLVGLNTMLTKIINHCVMLPQHFQFLNSSKSTRNRCTDIVNYNNIDNMDKIIDSNCDINISNLYYSYNKDSENTINGISFEFKKGKKYAIIGSNGSGKSTLVKLLAGLYHSYNGSIKYGEYEQNMINRDSLFNILSYVSQDVFIFEDSIENNIRLYNKYVNDEYKEIIKKLKIDMIINKSNAEDKNALLLSGGEKQKISLARVLLKKSKIIIADEPTSSLDKKSSILIENILLSLKDVLCIVITHDIDGHLQEYDEIIVLKDGKIVEHGKYNDLETIHTMVHE